MTKQRSGLNFASLGVLVGVLSMAFGACTRETGDDDGTGSGTPAPSNPAATASGGAVSGSPVAASGSKTGTAVTPGAGSTSSTSAVVSPSGGGAVSSSSPAAVTTGATTGCPGLPPSLAAADSVSLAAACGGTSVEAEPIPVDIIILMDRSISNSYAIGSETATPAQPGERTRWQVLTAALQSLATNPSAAQIGASITFFSFTGSSNTNDPQDCNAKNYETPIVPLGLLSTNGAQIVAAMNSIKQPSGLTPIVPALTGALKYAMTERQRDPSREKVVVMISDGFPTQCSTKPDEVAAVIKDGATAPIPIRTFIIGIGSPKDMDSAKFNLLNYARNGNTGKPPFVLNEAAGADQVGADLVTHLLNISNSNMACDYNVESPIPGMIIDPEKVMFTYQPNAGAVQEVPRVSSQAGCTNAPNGGWYFDNAATPTKITLCPCSCANLGAGKANVYYGCKPQLVLN